MSGFDHFPEDTLPFLSDLKANNTRDWFHAGKPRYEAALREPGAAFAGAMAGALADLTGGGPSGEDLPHPPRCAFL